MSHTSSETQGNGGSSVLPARYAGGWRELNRRIFLGASFSGQERNCAFLNTITAESAGRGTSRFATFSASTGLDFADDARATALVDWDHDGDQDLWVVNRSGPQLRFLRNDAPGGRRTVVLRLRGDGVTSNRDAIGARVEVWLPGRKVPLLRGLRAGEGYLSQSGKDLVVGVGDAQAIERVVVRWPAGRTETFAGIQPGSQVLLAQGKGVAEPLPPRKALTWPTPAPAPKPTDAQRVPLAQRLPLPALQPRDPSGTEQPWQPRGPTLVVLWATWCQPCLHELREITAHASQLKAAGLQVLAVDVDALEPDAKPGAAQAVLDEQKWPFASGSATGPLIDALHAWTGTMFALDDTFAIPMALLVDAQARPVVLYRGPVQVEQLRADLALTRTQALPLAQVVPFAGRWIETPEVADVLPLLGHGLLERNLTDQAIAAFREVVRRHPHAAAPHDDLGAALIQAQKLPEAEQEFQAALALDPTDSTAPSYLGSLWLDQGRVDKALTILGDRVKSRPDEAQAWLNLGRAQVRAEKPADAVTSLQRAVELQPTLVQAQASLANALVKLHRPAEGLPHYQQAVHLDDSDVQVREAYAVALLAAERTQDAADQLQAAVTLEPRRYESRLLYGKALQGLGKLAEAKVQFREALRIKPGDGHAAHKLAWLLATDPQATAADGQEAVRLAEPVAAETQGKVPEVLDTLAVAYAAAGRPAEAVTAVQKAIGAAQAVGRPELVQKFTGHLQAMQRGERVR